MVISQKQSQIAELIRERQAKQIFLIGALGTSKTFGAAVALLSVAIKYPGSLIPIGRKNLPELRVGTMLSFLEAAEAMRFRDFKAHQGTMQWTLGNGSILLPIALDHTKDPQFTKVKSINATCGMIDEADGVTHGAHIALFSRTGRRNANGAPSFIIDACNPNEAWIKDEVYDHWRDPEQHGPLPPDVAVIEFKVGDSFLGDDYYDRFESMPKTWRERYLHNNWNYGDDDNSLFKYRHMDRQHVDQYTPDLRYGGYDVARGGKDRSVQAMLEGPVLTDIDIFKDKDEVVDTADQAEMLKKYDAENLIGYENQGIDAVGIGVGVVDSGKKLGMYWHEFMAGAESTETITVKDKNGQRVEVVAFTNLRSQLAYQLSLDLERGDFWLYSGCPFLAEFKKEATMHNYEIKDKVLGLEPKDKVKQRLGHSPDIFDAVLMAYERWRAAYGRGNAVPTVGGSYNGLYGGMHV
jgi:phage terminase large subunit